MKARNRVGFKLLGVNLVSLLVALVTLLLVMQYLATRQILEWHRQRVELVARLVLAEYQGKIQRVAQAANLLADNPAYGELLAAANPEALRRLVLPTMQATGLNILTITDNNGVIQARAHDPEAIGVNISSNPIVRAGLQGKEASRMTQWKDNISLSAASPVVYQDRIVGVVLAGLLIDKRFVESLSRPGAGEGFHEPFVNEQAGEHHPDDAVLVNHGGGGAQGDVILPLSHAGGLLALEAGPDNGIGGDVHPDGFRVVGPGLDHPIVVGDGENIEAGGLHGGQDQTAQGLRVGRGQQFPVSGIVG